MTTLGERPRRDWDETITVLAGPEERRYTLHKTQLCAKSAFFAKACSKNWMEGQERIVRLPEHDADIFEVFVRWFYSEKIDLSTMYEDPNVVAANRAPSFLSLGKVWAMGHYLGSPAFCNSTIDGLLRKDAEHFSCPDTPSLLEIWEMTPPGSSIQKLLTDLTVGRLRDKSMTEEEAGKLPQDITRKAAFTLFKYTAGMPPFPTSAYRCTQYHEHDEGEPKCT